MYRLRAYDSPVLASLAAAFLRQHGVAAKVVGQILEPLGPYAPTALGGGAHTVAIAFESDRERALGLLEELRSQPARFDPDWEGQSRPDFTLLPADLPVPCPNCSTDLGDPVRAGEDPARCPGCGGDVDAGEAVVRAHGPEALADCCVLETGDTRADADAAGGDVSWITPELLARAPLGCPACGYGLEGLALEGRCPECGAAYDKRGLLDDLLDRM